MRCTDSACSIAKSCFMLIMCIRWPVCEIGVLDELAPEHWNRFVDAEVLPMFFYSCFCRCAEQCGPLMKRLHAKTESATCLERTCHHLQLDMTRLQILIKRQGSSKKGTLSYMALHTLANPDFKSACDRGLHSMWFE